MFHYVSKPCVLIMACIFMYHDLYMCFAIIFDRSMHCLHNQLWCFPYRAVRAPDPILHCMKLCTYPHCTKLPQNRICGCRTWHSKYWFTKFQWSLSRESWRFVPHPLQPYIKIGATKLISNNLHLMSIPRPLKRCALFSMAIIAFCPLLVNT